TIQWGLPGALCIGGAAGHEADQQAAEQDIVQPERHGTGPKRWSGLRAMLPLAWATRTQCVQRRGGNMVGQVRRAWRAPSGEVDVANGGAPGRTRTSTMSPPTDFESAASTNSATGARIGIITAHGGGSTPALYRGKLMGPAIPGHL